MPRAPLANESVSALPRACRRLLRSPWLAKLFHWNLVVLVQPTVLVVHNVTTTMLMLIAPRMSVHLASALPLSTAFGATVPMLPVTPVTYLDTVFADRVGAFFRVALLDPLENAPAMSITCPMQGPGSTAACSGAVRRVPVRKHAPLWCWGRGRTNVLIAVADLLEVTLAELALAFAEPCNRSRTLLLTIPRARARTPMRPNTQLTVDVGLTAVGVTLMDFHVSALFRLAA